MDELAKLFLPLMVVMIPITLISGIVYTAMWAGKRVGRWYNKRKPKPQQTFPLARCR